MYPLMFLVLARAWAVPATFSHSGRIVGPDGAPLEGAHALAFSLHDVESGGDRLWREDLEAVFDAGVYTVRLGGAVPMPSELLERPALWIELAVDGTTLSPRQPVDSVPYARLASRAEGLTDGVRWDELRDVPSGLADGDDTLDAAEVDAIVADNGYASEADLVAFRADVAALGGDVDVIALDVARGLAELAALALSCDAVSGRVDTLDARLLVLEDGAIEFTDALVAMAARLAAAEDAAIALDLRLAELVADGDADTLGALACADGEVPRWDEALSGWRCDIDATVIEGDVDVWVSDNGFATQADVDVLTASVDALDTSLAAYALDQAAMSERVDGLEDAGASTDAAVAAVDSRVDAIDTAVAAVSLLLDDLAAHSSAGLDALEAEVTSIIARVTALEASVADHASSVDGITRTYRAVRSFRTTDGSQGAVCALDDEGGVRCGLGVAGLYGDARGVTRIAAGEANVCVLNDDGTVDCGSWSLRSQSDVFAGVAVTDVANDGSSVCGVASSGSVLCKTLYASGAATAVSLGSYTFTGVAMDEYGWGACAVSSVGTVACWHTGSPGTPGTIANGATQVVGPKTGYTFCGVTSTGAARCWFYNGSGSPTALATPAGTYTKVVPGSIGLSVDACGIRASDGAIECWSSGVVTRVLEGAFVDIDSVTYTNELCAVRSGGDVWCSGPLGVSAAALR
jgi:hypothetical protein